MYKSFSFLLLFAVICVGCTAPRAATESTSNIITVTPTVTIIAPTAKQILPTQTTTPMKSPTISPTAPTRTSVEQKCVNLADDYKETASYSVSLLMQDIVPNITTYPYIYNILKNEVIEISYADQYFSYTTSPDSHQIAAISGNMSATPFHVIIFNTKGESIKKLPVSPNFFAVVAWIGNEKMLLTTRPDMETFEPSKLALLDLSNGALTNLDVNLPDYINPYPGMREWEEYGLSAVVPDPTLGLAVYPKSLPDGSWALSLYSIVDNKTVLDLPETMVDLSSTPRWAPDGEGFLVNQSLSQTIPYTSTKEYDQELYYINRAGEVERLTYLTNSFSKVAIGKYQWSPDGRKIALWLHLEAANYPSTFPNSELTYSLAVMDVATRKIIDYCVPYISVTTTPMWSPDGTQILIEQQLGVENYQTSILDLTNENLFVVKENSSPLGWLIEP